jgi:hypothetical protein
MAYPESQPRNNNIDQQFPQTAALPEMKGGTVDGCEYDPK